LTKDDGRMKLFIEKDQNEIKYIDIATAIASAVIDKPTDDQIMGIEFRLSASLEELKRFGYPVDQLLKSLQEREYGKLAHYL
jgi:hypothetical protein